VYFFSGIAMEPVWLPDAPPSLAMLCSACVVSNLEILEKAFSAKVTVDIVKIFVYNMRCLLLIQPV
jgi:hypothetical protein